MKSLLEEFVHGNLSPEARSFRRNSEYGQALRALCANEEKLLALLDEQGRSLFQAFTDIQAELERLAAVDNLTYGFRLGLIMTAEAFTGMDELTNGR